MGSEFKYTLEVREDYATISGELSIEETFDFINFFDKKDYEIGHVKIDFLKKKQLSEDKEASKRIEDFEVDFEIERARNKELAEKLLEQMNWNKELHFRINKMRNANWERKNGESGINSETASEAE
jgi:hypothetical protein